MMVGILHTLIGPVDRVGVVIRVKFLELWVYHHVVLYQHFLVLLEPLYMHQLPWVS